MKVLAALPHLQKIENLGHSMQSSTSASLFIYKLFLVSLVSNAGLLHTNILLLAHANCLTRIFLQRVLPVVINCLQLIMPPPREDLASTLKPCGALENILCTTLERLAKLECMSFHLCHQSVIFSRQNVL